MKYEETKKSTKYEVRRTKKTKSSNLQTSEFRLHRGFTLLEVLIAVFLLTIGLAGVFVVITKTLSLIAASPDKLIAAYLAQEGIEIVRNIRDTNRVEAATSWDKNLPLGDWQADYTTTAFSDDPDILDDECASPSYYNCKIYNPSDYLRIDVNGFYNYTSGTEITKFTRRITISDKTAAKMTVTVTVFWTEKGRPYNISVQEYLYNWH
jgi:prepilin-type N-terminal cleavage/methylation domain-containing protein